MNLKKDVRTVTEMKAKAARLLEQVNEERRPIIVTKDGKPRGVLRDIDSYEGDAERPRADGAGPGRRRRDPLGPLREP